MHQHIPTNEPINDPNLMCTRNAQNSITLTTFSLIHNKNIHIYPLCTFL